MAIKPLLASFLLVVEVGFQVLLVVILPLSLVLPSSLLSSLCPGCVCLIFGPVHSFHCRFPCLVLSLSYLVLFDPAFFNNKNVKASQSSPTKQPSTSKPIEERHVSSHAIKEDYTRRSKKIQNWLTVMIFATLTLTLILTRPSQPSPS
jgi:hypothetical protein